jgi:hypothetical protein
MSKRIVLGRVEALGLEGLREGGTGKLEWKQEEGSETKGDEECPGAVVGPMQAVETLTPCERKAGRLELAGAPDQEAGGTRQHGEGGAQAGRKSKPLAPVAGLQQREPQNRGRDEGDDGDAEWIEPWRGSIEGGPDGSEGRDTSDCEEREEGECDSDADAGDGGLKGGAQGEVDVDGEGHDPGEGGRHQPMDEGSGGRSHDDAEDAHGEGLGQIDGEGTRHRGSQAAEDGDLGQTLADMDVDGAGHTNGPE